MVAKRLLHKLALLRGAAAAASAPGTTAARALSAAFEARCSVATGAHGVQWRSFSVVSGNDGKDGNEDDIDDLDSHGLNGDVNPFERLLQHSQQFRQKMAQAEQSGLEADEEEDENDDDEADGDDKTNRDDEEDDDSSDSDSSDSDSSDSDSSDSDSSDSDSDDDDDAGNVDRFSQRTDRDARRPARGDARGVRDNRGARTAQSIKRRILDAPEDELDYVQELSKLKYTRAKERKYQQLLHREQDKDRVCRNCGERGHVAKHCLLPMICSNCGGIGHRMRDCIHPDYSAEDDTGFSKKKHKQKITAETKRLSKRHDKFKEEFDSQLEEYLEEAAAAAEKRKKRKADKQLADKETSQAFDPVIG